MRNILLIIALTLLFSYVYAESGEMIKYQIEGNNYEGYYTSAGENSPFIMLVHDWDGLTDYEVTRAEMLNKLGYTVFAVDMFGAGVRPIEMEDKRKLTGELYADREKMRQLLYGAFKEAEKMGANVQNAIAMGYCFGGSVVLEFARSGADLKAFVSFHGGLATPEGQDYSKTKGELLILHGSSDTAVPMEEFAALTKELDSAGIIHEMITYSGAQHAFSVFGGGRYNERADKLSWDRFIEFLEEKIK